MQKYERTKPDIRALEMLSFAQKEEERLLEKVRFQIPPNLVPFYGYAFVKEAAFYCPELFFIQIASQTDQTYWNIVSKHGLTKQEQMRPSDKLPLSAVTNVDRTIIKDYSSYEMMPNFDMFAQNNLAFTSLYAIAFVEPTAALRLTLLVNDGDAIMSTVISEDDNCVAWRKREYASGQLNIKRLDIEKEAISFQQRYWRDKNEPQPTFNSSYKNP